MPLPGAPTLPRNTPAPSNANQAGGAAPGPVIPFTRAARKKSRVIGNYGPFVLSANTQQLPPIQVPANGYIRSLILDVTGTAAGNSATVAFQNDGPFIAIQQLYLQAANGDALINPIDGFMLYLINKYGAFSSQGTDPCQDPTYTKVTGAVANGGSFHYQLEIPFEVDSRDALCALPNMAANQSFQLTIILNTLPALYSTAPTAAPSLAFAVTARYWAAPSPTNTNGNPQAVAPACNGAISLIQTEMPPVVPSTDQTIQLHNVGNVVRWLIFIARTAAGVRTETDWPNIFQLSVNNDVYEYKTKNNWRNDMADNYNYRGGLTAQPTAGALDNGVYVYTEFMNDGSSGDSFVSGASNRDLLLVTGSTTALNVEAQNWGPTISSLTVLSNNIKVPDVSSFYAPKLI